MTSVLACETRVLARVTPAIARSAYLARAHTRVLPFSSCVLYLRPSALSLFLSRCLRAASSASRPVERRGEESLVSRLVVIILILYASFQEETMRIRE